MARILVIYHHHQPRQSITDHLRSFARVGGHDCYFLDTAVWGIPKWASRLPVDLVIFHTTFLSQRWDPEYFRILLRKSSIFRNARMVKVAIPQDEFAHTDILNEFIRECGISLVFSAAGEADWKKIYSGTDPGKTGIHRVLTGYMDDNTIGRIDSLSRKAPVRAVDIGYRAYQAPPWLGRHGYMKLQIAEVFRKEADKRGLITDISTELGDTLMGDDWFKFLLKCRYTIGVEGGASILDRDGTVKGRTDRFMASHPLAGFPEIEAECFPGRDGELSLFALSPRHLEACATGTCQILVEGEYNGILKSGVHYIELKRDFSNLGRVFDGIELGDSRETIANNARRDIIDSGEYSYRKFVDIVVGTALKSAGGSRVPPSGGRDNTTWIPLPALKGGDILSRTLSQAWRTLTSGGPGKIIKNSLLKPLLLGTRRPPSSGKAPTAEN